MKDIVRKQDYEIYNFQLPLTVLFRGKKKQFIYSELEKRHPGFSEDWSYNTKFELNRNGINSKTLVMKKVKLAEYKNLAGFNSLVFENSEKNAVAKWKLNGFTKQIFITLFSAIIAAGIFITRERIHNEKFPAYEEINNVSNAIDIPVHEMKVKGFLESCVNAGGNIDNFNWISDGINEYFEAYVEAIFPENLGENNLIVNTVSFKGDMPYFRVLVKDPARVSDDFCMAYQNSENVFPALRNCIKKCDLSILEENYDTKCVKFICSQYKPEIHNCFWGEIDELFSDLNVSVNKVVLKKIDGSGDAEGFTGEIGFNTDCNYGSGLDIGILELNKKLFFKEYKKITSETSAVKKSKSQKIPGTKVGEIKHPDGTISVFYKNDKGKIVCVN